YDMVEHLTGHSSETNDLVAEIFTRVLESEKHVAAAHEIRNLINLTTSRVCQNHLKKENTKRENSSKAGAHYMFTLSDDTERAETYGHMGNFLWREAEKLPLKTREVIVLAYYYELTNKEIAMRLGMTEKTVSNHKTDAKKILKIEANKKGGRQAFYLFVLSLNLLYESL
ncbi:MAG TPA: RNA polymerase sigma factor, partial [Puia sp.]|nr:RNA polymerase sigma factor [Puia sp.]